MGNISYIIPVTSENGSTRREVHLFTIIKNETASGSAVIVVEGDDKDNLVIN